MSGIYLTDTNAVSDVFKGQDSVSRLIEQADEIYVPSIVLGELYFMAENSARRVDNYAQVEEFVKNRTVLDCNQLTGLQYAKIRFQLKTKGRPIPENDLWIAAIALQYQIPLLTRDQHFQHVDGLTVVGWS